MSLRVADKALSFHFQLRMFHLFLLRSNEQKISFIFETYVI